MQRKSNERMVKNWAFRALLSLLVAPSSLHGSCQNLVPNAGFEETDSCRLILGLGDMHDWYSAYLTPDHLQSCLPYGAVNGLPMNMFTYQEPFEGNSCIGLATYASLSGVEQREWIMATLLTALVPGQTYYCSFRANAGFGGNDLYPQIWLASNHVGMLFTTYDRHWDEYGPYPEALNRADIQYPMVLTDTVGWTLVSGSFVADSAYTYVMLGNFFSNAQSDTVHFANPDTIFPWYNISYTLIDAVCVSPVPNGCEQVHGIDEMSGDAPFVYPNPATDELFIGRSAGMEVEVVDVLGRRVWQGNVVGDRYAIMVANWARGSYLLRVHGTKEKQAVKFVLIE